MRTQHPLLGSILLAMMVVGCSDTASSPSADAPNPAVAANSALPDWMAQPSVRWAQRPWEKAEVGAVWRVRHAGREALLIDAPGRRHDTLVDLDGGVICKPAGFGAMGDGGCPAVADAGSTPRLLWQHPGNPSPTFGPPPELTPEATSALTAPPGVASTPQSPREPLPAWLETQIADWERHDAQTTDALSVARIQYHGESAYLVYANCCDRYNTLYDARGRELCSPSGGITGRGDEQCPTPEDPGTQRVKVWQHPGLSGH